MPGVAANSNQSRTEAPSHAQGYRRSRSRRSDPPATTLPGPQYRSARRARTATRPRIHRSGNRVRQHGAVSGNTATDRRDSTGAADHFDGCCPRSVTARSTTTAAPFITDVAVRVWIGVERHRDVLVQIDQARQHEAIFEVDEPCFRAVALGGLIVLLDSG